MVEHYSTREVAKLVNLPPHRIRALAKAGLVGQADAPVGTPPPMRTEATHWRFTFRDLAVLRMAARLIAQGLGPARVQRALVALRRQSDPAQPLSSTQIKGEDGRVVASDGAAEWEAESGQCLFRFGAKRMEAVSPTPLWTDPLVATSSNASNPLRSGTATEMAQPPAVAGGQSADKCFDLALACEEEFPEQAYDLYLRALAADPEHVEATINIGRLCSTSGDPQRAAAYFRQATRIDPAHPVAHFNLAVILHDLNEVRSAIDAYRAALLHDPHFADAHYNLADLLEQQGDHDEAARHYNAFQTVSRRNPS